MSYTIKAIIAQQRNLAMQCEIDYINFVNIYFTKNTIQTYNFVFKQKMPFIFNEIEFFTVQKQLTLALVNRVGILM